MSWQLDRDLGDLEERVVSCARDWRLRVGAPLAGGHRAGVFECWTPRGEEAVLKIAPTSIEAEQEGRALMAWADTDAAVRLLDADFDRGALLLERIRPATPLPPSDEPRALAVAADLLPRLHSVAPDEAFPTMAEMFPFLAQHAVDDVEYERRTRGEPARAASAVELLPSAVAAAVDLCETSAVNVLLHGDFIDKNVLLDGNRYVAADPIPRLGDPASDIGGFAAEHPPSSSILARAKAIGEETGTDPHRCQRWAAVWTVLLAMSAWRDDQPELEQLVTSSQLTGLLTS